VVTTKESISDSPLVIADPREDIYSRISGLIKGYKESTGNLPEKILLPFKIYFAVAERYADKSGKKLGDILRDESVDFYDEFCFITCVLDSELMDQLIELV